MPTVVHPRLRPGELEDRLYQERIAKTAVDHNTLVVLPTGLGKTAIAERVAAEFLLRHPDKSILFLAPTRPLVVQHGRTLAGHLLGPEPTILTGTVSPEHRPALFRPPQILVATPQVVANDLARGEFPLGTVSLIIFDEAHRAVGNYPYVAIATANREGSNARVLAMTASPGSQKRRIEEVWATLGIEQFEYRTLGDPDVSPYVYGIDVEAVEIQLPPELRHLAVLLRAAVQRQAEVLKRYNLLPGGDASRRALLALGERNRRELSAYKMRGENAPPALWAAITAHSVAMKELHALELVETEGLDAVREFFLRQTPKPGSRVTPAQRTFLSDPDVERVQQLLRSMALEHPKVAQTVEIVRSQLKGREHARVIVFTQYRDVVDLLVSELERLGDPGVRPARFVGQASRGEDEGLSQKEQVDVLDRFRRGVLNVLVSTSVAEEGLDIPSTDLVIFYEPLPDVIRTIQRRGRTGRARTGRVIVLAAAGTRDVGFARAASARERRMHEMLEEVEEEARKGLLRPPTPVAAVQRSLLEYPT